METYYLIIIAVLFLFAISDLIVGVSNDAVNFLNSALGSKAAPFKIVMLIAAIGILFGATFSSGMMEVARKGIFHPEMFYFGEIMIIFLAVMMTDVILLDVFNTLGMPTSTTVSIVFELLGAAVAVTILKLIRSGEGMENMGAYINSSKALAIISGILLSVVIAFTVGAVVQYFVRLAFTFNYAKTYKYFGALWGGIAVSAITYFILIKGAKGSSLLTPEAVAWIKDHTLLILLISFVGWSILLQLMARIFKINIFKIIVLIGTFALAMAFAGNDLVNFIGVPLAGLESFKAFASSSVTDPGLFSMEALKEPVRTPTIFLLIAGLVMVATLWFSKKARSVTKTTLDLSRQDAGKERFESSPVARHLVGNAMGIASIFRIVLPKRASVAIERRFDQKISRKRLKKEGLSFDLIRASVNLVVASILVALGTSLKLPLSTTYVTFMVAMGTSLADRAWGRESAVNRITGVVTVVGGWFLTAFSAFTVAFIVALIIHFGGIIAISILIALAIFFLFKTHTLHKRKNEEEELLKEIELLKVQDDGITIVESCDITVITYLFTISKIYNNLILGFINERRKKLKKQIKEINKLNLEVQILRDDLHNSILRLQEDDIETGHIYVQVLDALKDLSVCLSNIAKPLYSHVNNYRPPLLYGQKSDLSEFNEMSTEFFNIALSILKRQRDYEIDLFMKQHRNLLKRIKNLNKDQIKMIRKEETGTKISVLYLNTLSESKNLFLQTVNLVKSHREFLRNSR
jgi:phosphate/sulfate permease